MSALKTIFRIVLIFVGVMAVASLIMVFVLPNFASITSTKESLESISVWLMLIRLFMIALVWYFWNQIVDWYYSERSQEAADYLKGRRATFTLLFLVIELLLVQNVLGELWLLVNQTT